MTKRTAEKGAFSAIESTARAAIEQGEKVWLAGLGVLTRATDDSREWISADKVKLFDEYVDAGRQFADRAKSSGESQFESTREAIQAAFGTARDQAKSSYDRAVSQTESNVEKIAETFGIDQIFDRRVGRALEHLGYPTVKQFNDLKKKVNSQQKSSATRKTRTAKSKTATAAKKSA